MKIAVIGTGNVGGALAKKWAQVGHQVILGVRDTANFKGKELLNESNISATTIEEAAGQAEVILIAAVPQATADIVKSLGNVNGKIVIDAMNSVRTKPEGYHNSFEALKELCPGAEIVKCFNSVGFNVMADTLFNGVKADMYMAGSSERAKEAARQLAIDAGF